MALAMYNTLTRKKDVFEPLREGEVRIYTCGPTIYDAPHIGNLRAFVFYDALVRLLRFRGYEVKHVMNLTDVDDKTIRASRETGVPLREHTDRIASLFFENLETLGCRGADVYPRATETVPQMVDLIKRLRDKGHTYEMEGSTYFRVDSFPGYGKLSGFDPKELKAGARIDADEYEKEGASDFVLWKAWKEEDGDVYWETDLGKGRPGWHIECSTMALEHLGDTLDIHGGGVDLIFPHHENEIAQAEAATGKPFVRTWLHNGWLLSEGRKMSKSLKNDYVLSDIQAKGFTGLDLRYFFLTNHYRQQFNFTLEGLEAAAAALKRLRDFQRRLSEAGEGEERPGIAEAAARARARFVETLEDDVNTAGAIGDLHAFVGEVNRMAGAQALSASDARAVRDVLADADEVLGVLGSGEADVPEEIREMARERDRARASRDFERADALRDEIRARGYRLEDTPKGPRLKKA